MSGKLLAEVYKSQIDELNQTFKELSDSLERDLTKNQENYVIERLRMMNVMGITDDMKTLVNDINSDNMDYKLLLKEKFELNDLLPFFLYTQLLYKCYLIKNNI